MMRWRYGGWIAAVLLVAGAAGGDAIGQSAGGETSVGQSGDAVAENEGEMRADERPRAIDWKAAAEYRQLAVEDVPAEPRRSLGESPVPVLLPDDPEALEGVDATVTEHWYAAILEVDGREVTIEGDRVVRRVDDLELPEAGEKQAAEQFHVTQTHGVMTVTFTAFGAGYTVDIECNQVDEQGRCTNESFALEVANRLAVLGGER